MFIRSFHTYLTAATLLPFSVLAQDADSPEGGGCGGDGQVCCGCFPSICCNCDGQWLQPYLGFCGPCGGDGEPICVSGTACQPGLCNLAGICGPCDCGGTNEFCCVGSTCDAWNQCIGAVCAACGGNGQPFCASGTPCQPGLVYTAGLCAPPLSCGGDGELCCSPGCTCDGPWLQQYFGVCGPCGGVGEAFCLSGTPCQSSLVNTGGFCQPQPTCVTNLTDAVMHAYIPGAPFNAVILPSNTQCYPGLFDPNPTHSLWVELDADFELDFRAVVDVPAGGDVQIESLGRPWGVPDHYYLRAFDVPGAEVDTSDPTHDSYVRSVRFLASADCQYWNDPMATPGEIADANATNAAMQTLLDADPELRGILYAGDLTHYSRPFSEFAWYLDSVDDDYEQFLFDGVGNHDQIIPTCGQWALCVIQHPACVDPWHIRNVVRDRKRNTVKTNKSTHAHYSWDWHDVHFVQLNLYPGTDPPPPAPYCDDNTDGHQHPSPFESLDFVVSDLAMYVGNSGRPVVLIHHYGFDGFSNSWWTPAERVAYWNALAPYNVAAIFTGHSHQPPSSNGWRVDWSRPQGASGGPEFIPDFVAGAALFGAFLEAEINGAGQMRVSRLNNAGADPDADPGGDEPLSTECLWFANVIHVDAGSGPTGYGWSADPFATVAEALDSCADRYAECDAADANGDGSSVTLRIHAGLYDETMDIDQPIRIEAQGGLVRIGG